MAIVAVFEFPNDSIDKYEQVFALGGSPITNQPSRLHHVCYRNGSGFTVVDVWADEDSFAKFGETLIPVITQVGLEASPAIFPVQGIVTQDGTRSS